MRWCRTVKRQQQDLRNANADLEEKIMQRTRSWRRPTRGSAAEIAEKEDFLRAVSHDLNAPLRNISGMATMLLMKHREKFDEDIIHRLERIQKNVEVETDLIGELLELSRIKTRRQKMEMVEIEALVSANLADIFENDLKSTQIELIVDTPLPVLVRRAAAVSAGLSEPDRQRDQIHGRRAGQGDSRRLPDAATEAEFYVRDTGMGIDPEDLDKVFFIFRRGKNAAGAEHRRQRRRPGEREEHHRDVQRKNLG